MSGRKLSSTGFKSKKEKTMPAAVAICCLNCGLPLAPHQRFFCSGSPGCTSDWRQGRKKAEWNLSAKYGV